MNKSATEVSNCPHCCQSAKQDWSRTHDPDAMYAPICCSDEVVWVRRRINHIDPRFNAPVGRYKVILPNYRDLPAPCGAWIRPPEYQQSQFWRPGDAITLVTQRNSRSEEWSTLRQMLPSRGYYKVSVPPKWGVEARRPPVLTDEPQTRFPQVRSAMSALVESKEQSACVQLIHGRYVTPAGLPIYSNGKGSSILE